MFEKIEKIAKLLKNDTWLPMNVCKALATQTVTTQERALSAAANATGELRIALLEIVSIDCYVSSSPDISDKLREIGCWQQGNDIELDGVVAKVWRP